MSDGHIIAWNDGSRLLCPPNDVPLPIEHAASNKLPLISDIDVDGIPVIESVSGLPAYTLDIVDYVIERRGDVLSIHGEIGTVFERFLALMGSYSNGLHGSYG